MALRDIDVQSVAKATQNHLHPSLRSASGLSTTCMGCIGTTAVTTSSRGDSRLLHALMQEGDASQHKSTAGNSNGVSVDENGLPSVKQISPETLQAAAGLPRLTSPAQTPAQALPACNCEVHDAE